MNIKSILSVAVASAAAFASSLQAQTMTGLQIMKENDKQFAFKTEVSQMTMELINSSNKKRSRTVERHSTKNDKGLNSTLIRFLQPADVKGSGFLSVEHSKTDESRHLYLPALKKSRRISAGEDADSFMGSDLTYEDLDELEFDEYSFKNLGNETVNGTACYKVEVVPTDARRKKISGYSKRVYYIDQKTFVFHQVDYYDKHGKPSKKLTASDVKLVPGTNSFYRAYVMTMENLKTKHTTILRYKDYKINSDVNDDVFSIRNLERSN